MGSLQLSNPFAALEHKKAKKKKEKSEREKRKKDKKETLELEKAIFDQPQISVSSWADCDDDEDWGEDPPSQAGEGGGEGVKPGTGVDPEADSDHEIIDLEEEFGVELGKDEEHEVDENSGSDAGDDKPDLPVPIPKKKIVALAPERQLSKKELKKKEMEELNAVLAELGIDSSKVEGDEGKGSKKKKKKIPKAPGEGTQLEGVEVGDAESSSKAPQIEVEEKAEGENEADEGDDEEELGTANGEIDIENLKAKLARRKSASKKSGAGGLAAAEAKARAKKKGSKKDKTKFNQAPPRN